MVACVALDQNETFHLLWYVIVIVMHSLLFSSPFLNAFSLSLSSLLVHHVAVAPSSSSSLFKKRNILWNVYINSHATTR